MGTTKEQFRLVLQGIKLVMEERGWVCEVTEDALHIQQKHSDTFFPLYTNQFKGTTWYCWRNGPGINLNEPNSFDKLNAAMHICFAGDHACSKCPVGPGAKGSK